MITWTKIDIGDGEAIWYSDCLEYQISHRRSSIPYIKKLKFDVNNGDSYSTCWDIFDDLSSAKKWCEKHKSKHSDNNTGEHCPQIKLTKRG